MRGAHRPPLRSPPGLDSIPAMAPHTSLPRRRLATLLLLAAWAAATACAAGDAASTSGRAAGDTAGTVAAPARDEMDARLDSALRRFQAGLPVPAGLEGGEATRDALVLRFVRAIEAADTSDLRRMVMTRAEFAHLYYPGSAYTRRPTRQEADLVWFLHLQDSQKGVSRALARYGTQPLGFVDYACDPTPVREGPNTLWHGCAVRIVPGGDTLRLRLFGSILERDGRFKLYSFANDL